MSLTDRSKLSKLGNEGHALNRPEQGNRGEGRGEGGRSRGLEDGEVGEDSDVGEGAAVRSGKTAEGFSFLCRDDCDLLLLYGGGRSQTAAAPPRTAAGFSFVTAASPP
jgi:hypothetical protein